MPKKKATVKTSIRPISEIGLRRIAFGKGIGMRKKSKTTKRFHQWLCDDDGSCEPMTAQLQSFAEDPNWRIFRIMAEFIEGFEFLDKFRGEVSIFGSARTPVDDPFYQAAKKLGALLAKHKYTVITGGGPGIMEAANWGAFDAGGESIGLDIELPTEQRRNQFVTRSIGFHYFFTRKVMLSAAAQAYVFFPGGFGTLDEMSEMVTLVQTGKIPKNVPIILYGKKFWEPFLGWVKQVMYQEDRYIGKEDLALLQLVDSPEEALAIIRKTHERPYGSHEAVDDKHWKVSKTHPGRRSGKRKK